MSDIVIRNSERDPYHPQWVSLTRGVLRTDYVIVLNFHYTYQDRPIILTKMAFDRWNHNPDIVGGEDRGVYWLGKWAFHLDLTNPPTAHSAGEFVFACNAYEYEINWKDEVAYILKQAEEGVWSAQCHVDDYMKLRSVNG